MVSNLLAQYGGGVPQIPQWLQQYGIPVANMAPAFGPTPAQGAAGIPMAANAPQFGALANAMAASQHGAIRGGGVTPPQNPMTNPNQQAQGPTAQQGLSSMLGSGLFKQMAGNAQGANPAPGTVMPTQYNAQNYVGAAQAPGNAGPGLGGDAGSPSPGINADGSMQGAFGNYAFQNSPGGSMLGQAGNWMSQIPSIFSGWGSGLSGFFGGAG